MLLRDSPFTAEAALDAFLAFAPELAVHSLVAVRSEISPPWSMFEWV